MKVAVKYGAFDQEPVLNEKGDVAGETAGLVLVRRLLRLFPEPILIGSAARRGNGFDMMPLEFIDAENTVVINMDVIDSVAVWQHLHSSGAEPKVMNFEWKNPSIYHHRVNFASMGLSFALFPTFCNSARTAAEVREVVRKWTIQPLSEKARIAWVNLGVHVERVQPRKSTEVPVVLYPAITMEARKQPQIFVDVVERVAKQVPIQVEARLHESHLVSDVAMTLSRQKWAWVGPLTSTREAYWDALARTSAFLATASDESYGLEYVEAMLAGAVGVFPDQPWARALVPEGYPYFYTTLDQAEKLLIKAVTETEACRAALDSLVPGGSYQGWIRDAHNDDDFERAIVTRVQEWFGS